MMQTSEAINEIAEALVKAQAVITAPTRNREVEVKIRGGGAYKYKYATLDEVIEHIREPLTANGLWFLQTVVNRDAVNLMETMLIHTSGQWMRGEQPLSVAGQGSQEMGSAVTYARRYGLCSILGLAADADDDAKATRDITSGVGTLTAEPPTLEIFTPYGEVEDLHQSPKEYLDALTLKVRDVGAYWPANEHIVTWIGQFYNADKDVVTHARQVFKLGKDAWKQSPDNPANKTQAAE